MKKQSLWMAALIWFGAAISVAEIEAGGEIGANWMALVLGHLLGGVLLFFSGFVGARLRQGAMATTASAFGSAGARFFALLNVVQLIGWIAVMNEQTTRALAELSPRFASPLTHVVLSALVGIWVIVGILKTSRLATVAMGALAVLMAVLSFRILAPVEPVPTTGETMPFWTAFEISAAMPLSWAPVIADYTRTTERPLAQCALSVVVYTFASLWMYAVGMMLVAQGPDMTLPTAIVRHGLSGIGIPILIVSTVTTNLLAAHSTGESAQVVSPRLNVRAVVACAVAAGAALSIFGIAGHYISFLYFIASVFAPMAAVLVVNHFVVRRAAVRWNLLAWSVGFGAYQLASHFGTAPTAISLTLSAGFALVPRLRSQTPPANLHPCASQ